MGLFGFIKKAIGKVAKAGLSIVTHGTSDKVLQALKGAAGSRSPRSHEALLAKVDAPTPRTSRTEASVPGWGFSRDGYGGEKRVGKGAITKRGRTYYWEGGSPAAPVRRRGRLPTRRGGGKQGWKGTGAYEIDPVTKQYTGREWFNASGQQDFDAPGEYRFSRKPGGGKRARMPRKARSGAKRAPPKGGLDLKALSASWKAAGKPGTWQGWIKANA